MKLYDCLFKPHRYELPNGKVVEEKRSEERRVGKECRL